MFVTISARNPPLLQTRPPEPTSPRLSHVTCYNVRCAAAAASACVLVPGHRGGGHASKPRFQSDGPTVGLWCLSSPAISSRARTVALISRSLSSPERLRICHSPPECREKKPTYFIPTNAAPVPRENDITPRLYEGIGVAPPPGVPGVAAPPGVASPATLFLFFFFRGISAGTRVMELETDSWLVHVGHV